MSTHDGRGNFFFAEHLQRRATIHTPSDVPSTGTKTFPISLTLDLFCAYGGKAGRLRRRFAPAGKSVSSTSGFGIARMRILGRNLRSADNNADPAACKSWCSCCALSSNLLLPIWPSLQWLPQAWHSAATVPTPWRHQPTKQSFRVCKVNLATVKVAIHFGKAKKGKDKQCHFKCWTSLLLPFGWCCSHPCYVDHN